MPLVPAPVSAQSFEEWRWDFGTRRARILAWVLVVGHLSFVLLDFVARPEFAMVFLPTRIAMEIGFLVVLVLIYFDWHRAVPLVVGTTLIGGVGWITALATGPLDVYVGGMYLAVIGATTVLPVFIRWHVGGQIAGISIFVVGQLIHHPEVDGTVIFLVTFILVWVAFVVNLSMHLFAQQIRAELKAKAELVAAYERLAELDQAKTDFFANISHELRTPLTLILGTLRGLGQDGDNAAEQRQVMVGLRNGARLLMLINQLLDMSRMDSGVMEIKPVATDVSALVRHVVSSFDRSGTECQIELVLEPEPVWALIDPGLLRKLLFNLVSNAVKFTSATHGFVRVHLSHLGDGIRLAVDDNGPGVPVAMQAQIFERFTQVDMSETRQHEGTGIGLALVKSVAELHGGTVELASVPGQGACFVVLLPGVLTEQEPAALIQTGEWTLEVAAVGTSLVSERPRTGRALVLVVDDNADLREFVANLVYRTYDVVTSVDGLEALGLVKELEPALILSDLMMPRMSGQDLLRAVRELEEPVSQTPVILLTAKTQEEARLSALGAGADDYLHKPFTDQELMVRVRNQLDRRTHILEIQAQNQQLSQTLEAQVAELLRVGKLSEFVPEALRRALAEPTPNGVAFTRERLTCMFIDLVGYTALSERLEPEDLANLLNGYLCEITAEATLHRAVVDKFIGDAVMILFRASDHEDPAAQVTAALKVATGAHRRVAEMGPKWGCELQVRVGFETGMVTVGVFGSEVLRSMTAVGPTINLASRLQGACPPGSTYAGPGAQRAAALDSGERVVLKLKNIQSSVKVAVL